MKKFDVLVIGPVSLDHNIDCEGKERREIGGAVVASGFAAARSGNRTAVFTKLNPADARAEEIFSGSGAEVFWKPSRATCSIRNQYFTPDKEKRACTSLGVCDPFTFQELPDVINLFQAPLTFPGLYIFLYHPQKISRHQSLCSAQARQTKHSFLPGSQLQHRDHPFVMALSDHAELRHLPISLRRLPKCIIDRLISTGCRFCHPDSSNPCFISHMISLQSKYMKRDRRSDLSLMKTIYDSFLRFLTRIYPPAARDKAARADIVPTGEGSAVETADFEDEPLSLELAPSVVTRSTP